MPQSPDTPWDPEDVAVPSKDIQEPSASAVFLLDFLKGKNIRTGRLADLGSGSGRNSLFFARNDFEVHAIDRSDDALRNLEGHNVFPHCMDVSDFLLFEDGFFDVAIDIGTYEEIDPEKRENYRLEIKRVLKKEGYLLIQSNADDIRDEFPEFSIILKGSGFYILISSPRTA